MFTLNHAKKLSLSLMIKQTFLIEKPYQLIFFLSDSVTRDISNEALNLSDISNFKLKLADTDILRSSVMEISLHKSLIVTCINDLNQAKICINFLVKNIPVYPRPKCLIILYHDQKYNFTCEIMNVLKYAWIHKILDFTVINLTEEKNNIFFHYLNPFDSKVIKIEFNDQVQVFPNKFKHMKNYPLNVTFCSMDLYEKMKQSRNYRYYASIDYTARFMLKQRILI